MRPVICWKKVTGFRCIWYETYKHFLNTLEENIRARGAMSKLISDRAQSEVINCSQSILWALFIDDWQIEPHYQHQNFSKRS